MLRRVFSAVLLAGGAVPLAWALSTVPLDLRRTLAVGILLLIGLSLNLAGLLRRELALALWLRILAVLVQLAVLAAVIAARLSAAQALRTISAGNVVGREELGAAVQGATWLAAALAYVLLATAALPLQRRRSADATSED